MGAQITNKVFEKMTVGTPADGQGKVVFVAGSPVTEITRVYTAMPGGEVTADVIAPGYQWGGSHGDKDKVEAPVAASVPLASIIVAN